MTDRKKPGNGLLIAGGIAAAAAGTAFLLKTETGKKLLATGKEKSRVLGTKVVETATKFGSEALEKGRDLTTAGLDKIQEGINVVKEKIEKKPEEEKAKGQTS